MGVDPRSGPESSRQVAWSLGFSIRTRTSLGEDSSTGRFRGLGVWWLRGFGVRGLGVWGFRGLGFRGLGFRDACSSSPSDRFEGGTTCTKSSFSGGIPNPPGTHYTGY